VAKSSNSGSPGLVIKEAAKHVLAVSERQLAELSKRGDFVEVKKNGKEVSK
jgi:hypothetical protein